MLSLKQTIMNRDSLTSDQADSLIQEAVSDLEDILSNESPSIIDAEELLMDHFGLEPDYLIDLMSYLS